MTLRFSYKSVKHDLDMRRITNLQTALGLESVVQVAEYGVHHWRPVLEQ